MNKQQLADAFWQNELEAMNECEAAYKKYLDERQQHYLGLKPDSQEPERNYANDQSQRAHNTYLNFRDKAWASARKKNAELRKQFEKEEMYR